jgi:hypothetical protein
MKQMGQNVATYDLENQDKVHVGYFGDTFMNFLLKILTSLIVTKTGSLHFCG